MRRWLRRLVVRLALALESPADLAVGDLAGGRLPAGELSASLTTGEIQIRGAVLEGERPGRPARRRAGVLRGRMG